MNISQSSEAKVKTRLALDDCKSAKLQACRSTPTDPLGSTLASFLHTSQLVLLEGRGINVFHLFLEGNRIPAWSHFFLGVRFAGMLLEPTEQDLVLQP